MSREQKSFGSQLKRAQFRRIALRTGHVQNLSSKAFEKVRSKALMFLQDLVGKSVIYMVHDRRVTLSSSDVQNGLRQLKDGGDIVPKIYGSPPSKRCESYESHRSSRRKGKSRRAVGGVVVPRKRSSKSSSLIRQIRFYQFKQINCVHLPKAPLERLIKEIARNHTSSVRLSENAANLIIYALELYIDKQLGLAGLLSIHRKGRGNLSERDVEMLTSFEKMFLA